MHNLFRKISLVAMVSIAVVVISFIVTSINIVGAVSWQDPRAVAPNLGSLEPILNTSLLDQEKTGGFYVATIEGGLRVGSGVAGGEKMYVLGNSYLVGNSSVVGDINVLSDTDVTNLNAGSSVMDSIAVGGELLVVDDATAKILINDAIPLGLITVRTEVQQALTVESDYSAGNTIYTVNQNLASGSGIYGSGREYGINSTTSATGITVIGDGTGLSGATGGGLYAKGNNDTKGLVGRGLYGIVGLDNTEDINNPVFVGSGNSVAGLFEGSVDIIPSTGGNSDFIVDGNTLVVRALTNRVGIYTNNPAVRLHVMGENNISSISGIAGTNGTIAEYGSPTVTVAGVYGESGTVTYSGAGTGWNFGVYGKADNPGNSRSVGVMGVEYGSGDTFAGWFDGEVEVDGKLSVTNKLRTYNAAGILTANSRITGSGDLNLTNGDINLTGTDSGIFLTGNVNTEGDIEYTGKLNMYGGLPVYGTQASTCNVAPSEYHEGTMYTCNWCPTPTGQRYFAIMVRMNKSWVNIGYGKGANCDGNPYDPELPSVPQETCPDCPGGYY